MIVGNTIQRHEPDVVAVARVFLSGVSQSNKQFHAQTFCSQVAVLYRAAPEMQTGPVGPAQIRLKE